MNHRNPKIGIQADGRRWTMVIDRVTGVITLRSLNSRKVHTVTPERLIELAVGQQVMPIAKPVTRAPEHVETAWEVKERLRAQIAAKRQTAAQPQPVQADFV